MNRFSTAMLAAFVVACSGADNSGLLGDSGSQPEQDAAVVQHDAASTDDVVTVADATTEDVHEQDASVVIDAAPDVPVKPADSKIQCGPQTACSAQNEVCCWHQSSTTKPYECVTSLNSCAGMYDVPVTCTTTDNCASQGNAGYQCCAAGGNFGWGTCSSYEVASGVSCKASCDLQTEWEIGCSIQKQNCSDSLQTCVTSKCTLPGATMCY